MKKNWSKTLRERKTLLLSNALLLTMGLLHYFVYLGNGTDFPILQSYTDPPLSLGQLWLCEENYPSYLNPFRRVEYIYQGEEEEFYGSCELIETSSSRILSGPMEPQGWNPEVYWAGFDEEGFMRPLAGGEYANVLFFLVQYGLFGTWAWIILKKTTA